MKKLLARPYLVTSLAVGCSIPLGVLILHSSFLYQAIEQKALLGFCIFEGVILAAFLLIFNISRKAIAWISFDILGVHEKHPFRFNKETREIIFTWGECEEILFCSELTGDVVMPFVIVFSKEHFRVPDQRRIIATSLSHPNANKVVEGRKRFFSDKVIVVEYRKRVLRELLKYVDKNRILYPEAFAKRKPRDYAEFYGAD